MAAQSQFIDPSFYGLLLAMAAINATDNNVATLQGDVSDIKGLPIVTHSFSGVLTNERLIQGGAGVTVNIGATRVTISSP